MNDFELENWLPMEPAKGPPLPRFLNILWPWYKPEGELPPELPPNTIAVALKNPPSGATLWQLILCDQNITVALNQIGGTVLNDVAEPIAFEVPSGVQFPLRVVSLQISKWNAAKTAIIVLYEIQSMHANQYNWDAGTYTGPADSSYRAVFISSLGSYYYNVATQQFEKV